MEIALREAMEKAKARKQDDKARKNKGISQEQEEHPEPHAGRKSSVLKNTRGDPRLGVDLAAEWSAGASWNWERRAFAATDVTGCLLVIAATDDREVNRAARGPPGLAAASSTWRTIRPRRTFTCPGCVRRGPLQLTVTTGGLAPAVSARLRRRLEASSPRSGERRSRYWAGRGGRGARNGSGPRRVAGR